MNTITPQSLTLLDSSGKTRTESSEKVLPAGGSLQATVRQVSQDQLSPNVFRLKVEANSTLMELKVQQPIAQGSQITLSRANNGQLSVTITTSDTSKPATLNTTNASQTTNTNNNTSQTNRTYQATATPVIRSANDVPQLNRLIPQGQIVNAQVNAQTTAQPLSQQPAASPQTNIPTSTLTSTPTSNTAPLSQPVTGPTQVQQPIAQTKTTLTQSATQHTQAPLLSTNQTSTTVPTPQTPSTSPSQTPKAQSLPGNQSPTTPLSPLPLKPELLLPKAGQPNNQPQIPQLKYNTEPSPNIIRLTVKGETISLKTTSNLPPLQQVQILRNTNDQFTIRWSQPITTPPTNPANPLTAAQTQTIESSMRELLPQQMTITSGVQQLLNSTQLSTASAAGQIDKVVQSLMQLFGVQPGAAEAQQAIKQNISYGGLFTENKLANNQPPSKDMKKFLGKMQALAEQLPDAQKQIVQTTVEKMLARVTTNQLNSLQQRQERIETNERFFQLDLPVQNQNALENVELRISQRSRKNNRDEPETIWKVRLHFDLGDTGNIDAELSLNQEQNELTAAFTCSKDDTVSSIRRQLDDFKAKLNALGLKVPALVCKQGQQHSHKTTIQKQLIDIKT